MTIQPGNTSPYLHGQNSVASVMRQVLIALIPGSLLYILFFGWGVLIQIIIAMLCALACESLALKLRAYPLKPHLLDNSALVTALLFALTVSPFTPWWITCIGIAFSIIVVKHLYGGIGNNIFNPAMAGYLFVLLSFPAQMDRWPLPEPEIDLELAHTLEMIFLNGSMVDGLTGATPLGHMQSQLNMMAMVSEIRSSDIFGIFGGKGWEWIAVAHLLGGIWLIFKRIIDWKIPAVLIAALFIISALFYFVNGDVYAPPLFHIFSGGTLLCAFFIATDPVSSSNTPKGIIIYAAGTGILLYIIRTWASFPDGVAFAVLIMNCAVPLIDRYTRPPVLGEAR